MPRKYLRLAEVIKVCGVDRRFIIKLEEANVITAVTRRQVKYFPLDQVERVRVARLLIEEMGVNLEGAEVALHMREQMIAMQRQFDQVLRALKAQLEK